MEVIRETLWKRCLSTPIKPPAKNCNICLSETAYQHKGTRKECKKTNQAAIIQWQRQCLMDKAHRKPWPKSKTSDISKQSPGPLHHTFLLGRARFTAQPLSALVYKRFQLPLIPPGNQILWNILTNLKNWTESDKVWSRAKSLFGWRFRCCCRRRYCTRDFKIRGRRRQRKRRWKKWIRILSIFIAITLSH